MHIGKCNCNQVNYLHTCNCKIPTKTVIKSKSFIFQYFYIRGYQVFMQILFNMGQWKINVTALVFNVHTYIYLPTLQNKKTMQVFIFQIYGKFCVISLGHLIKKCNYRFYTFFLQNIAWYVVHKITIYVKPICKFQITKNSQKKVALFSLVCSTEVCSIVGKLFI